MPLCPFMTKPTVHVDKYKVEHSDINKTECQRGACALWMYKTGLGGGGDSGECAIVRIAEKI